MNDNPISNLSARIKAEVGKAVVGQDETLDLLVIALLTEGHILLEGVPGTAKTLLAQAFARCLDLDFGRIQFTPDLMPGDVIGTNLFDFRTNQFNLTKGPLFTQLLLADEINRTPPKTQAALLQAMQERKVSIDGQTHVLDEPFMVVATQNPIEQQGTYPLPEAQLDRFLFKHVLDYPSADEERRIVRQHGHQTAMPNLDDLGINKSVSIDELRLAQKAVAAVRLNDDMVEYVVELVRATRQHPSIQFGGSPRAATMMTSAARAFAILQGRGYVIPDDVKALAIPCLRHRLILSPGSEIEGTTIEEAINSIIAQIPAPR